MGMIRLESGDFGWDYLVVDVDTGRDLLVQTDWDYPGLASTFGWSTTLTNDCDGVHDHQNTDGTADCEWCGTTASEFISDAASYLDDHIGDVVEDPGYFGEEDYEPHPDDDPEWEGPHEEVKLTEGVEDSARFEGQCNCENGECEDLGIHVPGNCRKPAGRTKYEGIGSVCNDCAKRMGDEYRLNESRLSPEMGEDKTLVGRWQSKGGKYWIAVYEDEHGFFYRSDDGGGSFGYQSREQALAQIEGRVADMAKIDGIRLRRIS